MVDESSKGSPSILVVDDDAGMRTLVTRVLEKGGWSVTTAGDGQEALEKLRAEKPQVILTDLRMPRVDGLGLLKQVVRERPGLPVVVLTAHGSLQGAVDAMRIGAFDFLSKPLPGAGPFLKIMSRALDASETGHEPGGARTAPVSADPVTENVFRMAQAVAVRDTTVMITGESGVGKEVLAEYIHDNGPHSKGPFVALNCAAIPESLLESELFGHERGAFTGATSTHAGKFEQADGGTLLLDEVGEMARALQAKFLRVLERRQVARIGGKKEINVNVRVLAATNRNLEAEVEAGNFRQDLFYRLNVFPIHIPPLRERPGDILPLAHHFLSILRRSPGHRNLSFAPGAQRALTAYSWPGNIRELQNTIERAVILAGGGEVTSEHLGLPSDSEPESRKKVDTETPDRPMTLKEIEKQAIADALFACDGHRRRTAERLGIALRTLQYKIKQYGLK